MRGLLRVGLVGGALVAALLTPGLTAAKGAPSISWSPSSPFDFGDVGAGDTSSQTFTLTNRGGTATGVLAISLSGSAAFSITADGCAGTALGPGKACTVTVAYTTGLGATTDSATLRAGGKKPPASASVSLSGGCSACAPDLTVSPGNFNGRLDTGTNTYDYNCCDDGVIGNWTQTFTVTNAGSATADGQGAGLSFSGTDAQFSMTNDGCTGTSLSPGDSCTFDLTFTQPAGCAWLDNFQFDLLVNVQNNGSPYIDLVPLGYCG